MTVVTCWLLYRRDCEDMGLPQKRQLSLLKFKYKIAEALCREEKITLATSRKGKRSTSLDKAFEAKKAGVMLQKPYHSRLYEMTMWIIFPFIKRGRCKLPGCNSSPYFFAANVKSTYA